MHQKRSMPIEVRPVQNPDDKIKDDDDFLKELEERFGWSKKPQKFTQITREVLIEFTKKTVNFMKNPYAKTEINKQLKVLTRCLADLEKVTDGRFTGYGSPIATEPKTGPQDKWENLCGKTLVFHSYQEWKQHHRDSEPLMNRTNIGSEISFCISSLKKLRLYLETIPSTISPIKWLVWNLAPFFRERRKIRTQGHVSWVKMNQFIVFCGGPSESSTLRKAYKSVLPIRQKLPYNYSIAKLLLSYKDKNKIDENTLLNLAHKQAWKRIPSNYRVSSVFLRNS